MKTINIPIDADFLTIDITGLITFYKRVDHVIICTENKPVPTLLVFIDGSWIYKR